MFIFKDTKKRANIHAPYEAADGTRYPSIPRELLEEIPEPAPPVDYSENTYYRTEQDDAPYVVYTPKSPEQIAAAILSKKKAERTTAVATVVVTTIAGNTFDGDEASQDRMARAIVAMDDGEEIPWVLSDNSIIKVSKIELREALRLAGIATTIEWVKPYAG